MLNSKQRRVLFLASVAFVAMGLRPPWTRAYNREQIHSEEPIGYSPLWSPPYDEYMGRLAYGFHIDGSRLAVQWLLLIVGAGAAIVLLGGSTIRQGSPDLASRPARPQPFASARSKVVALCIFGVATTLYVYAQYRQTRDLKEMASQLASRNAKEVAEQKVTRQERKIRIGDSPSSIRLRLGSPNDTTQRNWSYGKPQVAKFFFETDTVGLRRLTVSIYRLPDMSWMPEDSLQTQPSDDVDEALKRFKEKLGSPCAVRGDDNFASYFYKLSAAELSEDSLYGRLYSAESQRKPVRLLVLSLRGARTVYGSGYTEVHQNKRHADCFR